MAVTAVGNGDLASEHPVYDDEVHDRQAHSECPPN